MDDTSITMKSLAACINQKNINTPYQQIFLGSNENKQENACTNADLLNALQEIASLDFDPNEKSYPFSARMQSDMHNQLIEHLRKEITHPDIAWLLHDLFWTNNRKPEHAKSAAEYACKSAHSLHRTRPQGSYCRREW